MLDFRTAIHPTMRASDDRQWGRHRRAAHVEDELILRAEDQLLRQLIARLRWSFQAYAYIKGCIFQGI